MLCSRSYRAQTVRSPQILCKGPIPYLRTANVDFHHGRWLHASSCYAFAKETKKPRKAHPASLPRHVVNTKQVLLHDKPAFLIQHATDKSIKELTLALERGDSAEVSRSYLSIKDVSRIPARTIANTAQHMHECVRNDASSAPDVLGLVRKIVKDITHGQLTPSRHANVHILGTLKELGALDDGVQFWTWLEMQDDTYLSPYVYGAAIELLVQRSSLQELEKMYEDALAQFPGNFAAYHFRSDAIVLDRNKPFPTGVPMALLQGILTARLRHGNVRKAYLTLDTALRILPDRIPTRFVDVFLDSRPISEIYALFAIACRATTKPSARLLSSVLLKLRKSFAVDPKLHLLPLRAMLSAVQLYRAGSGILTTHHLNELVISMTRIMRVDGVANSDSPGRHRIADRVMGLVQDIIRAFAQYDIRPGVSAFNSIIGNVGGFGISKGVVGAALADIAALELQPTDATWRSVLSAAGMLREQDLVATAWEELLAYKAKYFSGPKVADFQALAKVTVATGQLSLIQQALTDHKESLSAIDYEGVLARIASEIESMHDPRPAKYAYDPTSLLAGIQVLQDDLAVLAASSPNPSLLSGSTQQSSILTLEPPPESVALRDVEMHALYDEMTTEQGLGSTNQNLSEANTTSQAEIAPNGSLGDLRYANWKSITYLLEESEAGEKAFRAAVDEAIATGARALHREAFDLEYICSRLKGTHGLSGFVPSGHLSRSNNHEMTADKIQAARRRIMELRGKPVG